MKRIGGLFAAITISLFGVLFAPSLAVASVNDFSFSKFEGDYYLSKDADGRSRMKVVETFTAEFPENKDQNKGVVRAIPQTYDGHSVSLNVESLTRNGKSEPIFNEYTQNNNRIVETGTDDYLRGAQTYVLTYTLRDVTKSFADHQEFYWDTNGAQSSQQFDSVTARVHLDDSVRASFTGDIRCYQGAQGSRDACSESSAKDSVVTFSSGGELGPGENVSMVLRFDADTFKPYSEGTAGVIKIVAAAISVVLFAAAIAWLVYIVRTRGRSAKGYDTIVPQYLPPKDHSLLFAANFHGNKPAAISAQIIDLAVRHVVRIIEGKKSFLGTQKYKLELLDTKSINDDEHRLLELMFPDLKIGETYEMKYDSTVAAELGELVDKLSERVLNDGYTRKIDGIYWPLFPAVVSVALALTAFVISMFILPAPDWTLAVFIGSFIGVIILLIICASLRPKTEKGAELLAYLKGLEMYIKLAEIDRLKMLQSVKGAERKIIDTEDSTKMVALYEKVLPYAILFGQEKTWANEIGKYYEARGENPSWYSGNTAFHSAVLASSLSSFSQSAGMNFSPPSSSGGSGFSGGGGYSGGGGGGGGFGGR